MLRTSHLTLLHSPFQFTTQSTTLTVTLSYILNSRQGSAPVASGVPGSRSLRCCTTAAQSPESKPETQPAGLASSSRVAAALPPLLLPPLCGRHRRPAEGRHRPARSGTDVVTRRGSCGIWHQGAFNGVKYSHGVHSPSPATSRRAIAPVLTQQEQEHSGARRQDEESRVPDSAGPGAVRRLRWGLAPGVISGALSICRTGALGAGPLGQR
jgi:hypothetical protein